MSANDKVAATFHPGTGPDPAPADEQVTQILDAIRRGDIMVCPTRCEACQFGYGCRDEWHTWAGPEDVEHARDKGLPDPTTQQCGCHCQKEVQQP